MALRIAVCDDELFWLEKICRMTEYWARKAEKEITIQAFQTAAQFLFAWNRQPSYDVLLLDIQMPGQDGMALARTIRETDRNLSIVFITGTTDFIQQGYEVEAKHYLIKPVEQGQLNNVLDRACCQTPRRKKTLLLECAQGLVRLEEDTVEYIESFSHTVCVHTTGASYEVRRSLSSMEEALSKAAFVRCHRSYLVNLEHIQSIRKETLLLESGIQVPLSRRMAAVVNERFIAYYRRAEQ